MDQFAKWGNRMGLIPSNGPPTVIAPDEAFLLYGAVRSDPTSGRVNAVADA